MPNVEKLPRFWAGEVGRKDLKADGVDGTHVYVQTREVWFPCGDGTNGGWVLDGTNPAAAATLGTNAQALVKVLNFDAYSTDTDDEVFLGFVMPSDYKVDSASLILVWAHTDANNGADEAIVWDADVNAVEPGASTAEAFDAAGTAVTAVSVDVAAASAGKVYKTTLDIEVEAIAALDLVTVHLWVDASACEIDTGEHVQLLGAYLQYSAKEA